MFGVESAKVKCRQARLRWFGQPERQEEQHVTKRAINTNIPRNKKRG